MAEGLTGVGAGSTSMGHTVGSRVRCGPEPPLSILLLLFQHQPHSTEIEPTLRFLSNFAS